MEKIVKILKEVECPILNKKWMEENNKAVVPGLKVQVLFKDVRNHQPYIFLRCYCQYNNSLEEEGICSVRKQKLESDNYCLFRSR